MTARLLVTTPAGRPAEREWIARVLLENYLGQAVDVATWERDVTAITCAGHDGSLAVPDGLLGAPPAVWLTSATLPAEPLRWLHPSECVGRNDLPFDRVPAIYWPATNQTARRPTAADAQAVEIPFDLFGGAFFMLTRYEECLSPIRDKYGRFPASASLALRQGFLETPVVDQYAELLWTALNRLWPALPRPARQYRLWVSHDVDSPFFVYRRDRLRLVASALREGAADLLMRRDVALAARRARAMSATLVHGAKADPHFNLQSVMDIDEAHQVRATYFYMADNRGPYGVSYSLDDPEIRGLLRITRSRGHEIGLHASYGSMCDAGALNSEWLRLRSVAASLGIEQASWGSRAHFLRWSARTGFGDADGAGADFDNTLTYADQAGFRCGTCREYAAFDLRDSRALRLRVRPLIAMESSVIDPQYMGKTPGSDALDVFRRLARQCETYGGTFALLWHNHRLLAAPERRLYEAVLEECS